MKNMLKKFWSDESGMGTVEIVLIVSVLIAISMLFGQTILAWVGTTIEEILGFKVPWLQS